MISPSEKDLPFITLLVLNYNGAKYLKPCLDSILATEYPKSKAKVVVVDNGSTDNSAEFIRKNYPDVEIIQNSKNLGYACAINLAMKSVKSEYVAFLNNDIVVESNWLMCLVSCLKAKKVAAVNPKILFLSDKETINAAGGSCDIYGVGWNRGNGEIDRGQYDEMKEVFYVNGAALLTRKDVWREVGPFDERYFLYSEDLDWCWRARLKGYEILYVPSAKIYHHWQGSRGSIVKFLERHWLASFLKNCNLKTIFVLFPRFLSLKFLKAIWLTKNGEDIEEKLAVFHGFLWNLINFKCTWRKHLDVQASRRVSDEEIQKYMCKRSFELAAWMGNIEHPLIKRLRGNKAEVIVSSAQR